MLSPGIVMNETKGSMMSFMFVEYFDEGDQSDPWALAAFEPINEPYYLFVDKVGGSMKKSQ